MSAQQTLIHATGELEFHFSGPDSAAFFRIESH